MIELLTCPATCGRLESEMALLGQLRRPLRGAAVRRTYIELKMGCRGTQGREWNAYPRIIFSMWHATNASTTSTQKTSPK
jgi:hypothetical protein